MNEQSEQVFDADDVIKKVDNLPTYLQFVNNACLVEFIKQSFKDARKYESFFLHKKDGEVKELWGVVDKYPYSTTYAYRISTP
jgi:thioredoxin-related protein